MSTGRVMTVRGPVPAPDLGITLMHEHVFIDLSFLWDAPTSEWQKPLVDAEITLANRGLLQVDPYVSRRNLVLDDFDVAVRGWLHSRHRAAAPALARPPPAFPRNRPSL